MPVPGLIRECVQWLQECENLIKKVVGGVDSGLVGLCLNPVSSPGGRLLPRRGEGNEGSRRLR